MKVGITTSGINMDAPVYSHFGRAPKLMIYDLDLDTYHVQKNEQSLNAAQGAGIQTALHLCDEKVECVITGNCGPIAYETLRAAGVSVCTCPACTIAGAIEKLKHGDLVPCAAPNANA